MVYSETFQLLTAIFVLVPCDLKFLYTLGFLICVESNFYLRLAVRIIESREIKIFLKFYVFGLYDCRCGFLRNSPDLHRRETFLHKSYVY